MNGDLMKDNELFNEIIFTLSGTYPTYNVSETLNEHDLKLFKLAYGIISQYCCGIEDAYICYKIGLHKELLLKFFEEVCLEDMFLLKRTFLLWKNSVFSNKEIKLNLTSNTFIPFINTNINVNGVNYENFHIDVNDTNWLNYKNELLIDYRNRLNKHLKNLNNKKNKNII